jgi:hypothetical protein
MEQIRLFSVLIGFWNLRFVPADFVSALKTAL